jgi:cellulose biosynthesis protein BcsQ
LSLRDRYDNALEELWKHRKTQKTIAMVNSKGGAGKTALTVWLASFYAFAISRHVLVLDANENAGGNPANRLGIHGKSDDRSAGDGTIELRDYLKKCESGEINDLQTLTNHVEWNRETGVSVISSERRASQRFSQESFMKGLRMAKRLSHAVFCDLGNDVYGIANFGSIRLADALVFPANVNMADSLAEVADTMEKYRQRGQESRTTEFDIQEKINNAVIVILGAKPKERAVYAKRYGYPIEQVFVVPFNRYMANNTNQVHLTRVSLHIRVILLEILVAIVKTGNSSATNG